MGIIVWMGVVLFLMYGGYKYIQMHNELQELQDQHQEYRNLGDQMAGTLALGLYHRFNGDKAGSSGPVSDHYQINNPYEFEYFVADMLEGLYGGSTFVTQGASNGLADLEHERQGSLTLVQLHCLPGDVSCDSVAVLHSQVVKQKANKGMIITTSGYTEEARSYGEQTGIRLVDGMELVSLWRAYYDKKTTALHKAPASETAAQWKPIRT